MNEYEGLSLPQLLDLMHDLVRPDPIAWTPQTVGWAVVGVWLFAVLAMIAWHRVQVWRRNRYRRAALMELRTIGARTDLDEQAMASEIATLLKRTALAAYDREQVADLYGGEWADFLCKSSANDRVVARHAEALCNAAYSRTANGPQLIEPAQRWIQVHRA